MNREFIGETLTGSSKYLRWYLDIMEQAQGREPFPGSEKHHILPTSLFKEFDNLSTHPWNAVRLSHREHFIAHLCIWNHYRYIGDKNKEIKMGHAIHLMSNQLKYNSRHYSNYKIDYSMDDDTKKKISETLMGHKHTEETIEKIKVKRANQVITKETGEKISKSNKGRKVSQKTKDRISKSKKGVGFSEEHKQRLSEAKIKSGAMKGLNNPRANKIEIYNRDGELIGVSLGNFGETCKSLGIPESPFKKSYQTGMKVYEGLKGRSMITKLKAKGFWEYKDWYAKTVKEIENV